MEKYKPNYSCIEEAVAIPLMDNARVVLGGAGGLATSAQDLARLGIEKLTVIDFDRVESSNLVRQSFEVADIGKYKVDALEEAIHRINPTVEFVGIKKRLQDLSNTEKVDTFGTADLLILGTDSFHAQAYGNIVALEYGIPTIWAGWYEKSRTAELFFQIPGITPACFRCAASSRYIANEKEEIKVSSNANTILHSQILDCFIGFIALAILHRDCYSFPERSPVIVPTHESNWLVYNGLGGHRIWEHNFFQFKVHPLGGNPLFEKAYDRLGHNAFNFQSYWQKVEPELKSTGYDYDCPDCQGKLLALTQSHKK